MKASNLILTGLARSRDQARTIAQNMLCDRCKNTEPPREEGDTSAKRNVADTLGELRALICEICGSILPATDHADSRGRKMEQLARFGIGVSRRTLLEP